MKKVLIITYAWPPKGGVGVMRVLKFAKYLPQFGWMPSIITTDENAPGSPYRGEDIGINLAAYRVIRTRYKSLFLKLPDRLRKVILMPDIHRGWFDSAYETAVSLLKEEKFDAIFSTSPPEISHLIARALKKRFGIPWIADLRDLWSDDHFERESFLRHGPSLKMEKEVLNDADSIVTVSKPWADKLAKTSGVTKINVITNGFDEEDFHDIPLRHSQQFTMAYTGKLHEEMQDPEMFFKTLSDCIQEGLIEKSGIDIKFYTIGFRKARIKELAKKYFLDDVVDEYPAVQYKESLRIQRESTLLLFFQWKGERGWYSAKLFEYIGSGKPIFAVSERDSVSGNLIKELNAGFVSTCSKELKQLLLACYKCYREKGYVSLETSKEKIQLYTRKNLTRLLANILDGLVVPRDTKAEGRPVPFIKK